MSNLISTTDAFNAMIAGKTILCRDASNSLLQEFCPVSEFSADVWIRPNIEFTIQIEMLELAGCSFPKPLVLSDIQPEQDIYIVMPSCILRTKFHPENKDVMTAIVRGYAQPDADSAMDQARAMSLALGLDYVRSAFENIQDGFTEKPKKRTRKTKITDIEEEDLEQVSPPANDDTFVAKDTIAQNSNPTVVEKKQWTQFHNDQPVIDPIKSKSKRDGLILLIRAKTTIETLDAMTGEISQHGGFMTFEDYNAVTTAFSQHRNVLAGH
ncbi:MAG: hypothetical protein QM666_10005 [Acinetobacter sp.]